MKHHDLERFAGGKLSAQISTTDFWTDKGEKPGTII